MSEIEIKVPELSESVSSAEVLGWKVKPGDPVEEDQVLVELETDKVVLEVSAPCDGVVTEILVKEGDTVKTGDVVEGVIRPPKEGGEGRECPSRSRRGFGSCPRARAGS